MEEKNVLSAIPAVSALTGRCRLTMSLSASSCSRLQQSTPNDSSSARERGVLFAQKILFTPKARKRVHVHLYDTAGGLHSVRGADGGANGAIPFDKLESFFGTYLA